jgi:DNA mismatch repair protein MutS
VVNVHARCEERDGKLLFLHKIEPGRADKSYGIHVAELAEMPGRVIERAREILAGLEANAAATSAQEVQMTLDALWAAPVSAAKEEPVSRLSPDEETVMAELRELDLNQMTPMEAMLKLYEWRQRLKKT